MVERLRELGVCVLKLALAFVTQKPQFRAALRALIRFDSSEERRAGIFFEPTLEELGNNMAVPEVGLPFAQRADAEHNALFYHAGQKHTD